MPDLPTCRAPDCGNAAKTHCYRGHELAGDNLHVNAKGQRGCRACSRIKTAAYRARRAA